MTNCNQAPVCGDEYYVPPIMPCLINSDKKTHPWCLEKADGTPICQCGNPDTDENKCGNTGNFAQGYATSVGPICHWHNDNCVCNTGSGVIIEGIANWGTTEDHKTLHFKGGSDPRDYTCPQPWKLDQQWTGHVRAMC